MPRRWASRPMVSSWKPTSSASSAAAAITPGRLRPALGMLAPFRGSGGETVADEAGDEPGDLIGTLRVNIVPAALDHRDRAGPGGHRGHDPLGLGPGVGPVGVLVAHDDQGRAGDARKRVARVSRG